MKTILYKDYQLFIPDRYFKKQLINRLNNNSYESPEASFVKRYCDTNDYVLEIGAGLGYVTSLLANKCAGVIAVEANPELEQSLFLTILANNLTNTTLICSYISNSKNSISFDTYDFLVAGSADRKDNARNWKKTKKTYKINCINIKDIPNINLINTLVMDCEGGELTFLEENTNLLQQCSKVILELHESMMFPGFNKKCLQLLKSNNFVLKKNYKNKLVYLVKNTIQRAP
jgi:FkbM family methyltransferase